MKLKIMRKIILFSIVCFFAITVVAQQKKEVNSNSKPNILMFIADDLARNELGCYGGQNVMTPNIDRFASQGVQFNQMYASEAMCCPIRASIYTGLYPAHHGVYKNHAAAHPDVVSVVQYMTALGYRVGLTGKRHIRPESVYPFEFIDGFEENCVKRTANYDTKGIIEFMSRDDKQPFCLFVCSTNPHAPWTVGDASVFNADSLTLAPHMVDNKETREILTHYLAEIAELDRQFGDVLKAVESASVVEKTMVIFSGEQGPQFPGGKWTSWDYGQKSAFLISAPEGYLNGTKQEAILQYEDVLPTLISYAGGKIPAVLEGKSFLPVLQGKTSKHRQWAYGIHNNFPEGTPYPIRSIRNDKYKLILNLSPELSYFEKHLMNPNVENYWASWVRDAKSDSVAKHWVERYVHRPAVEFYDIKNDPWELNNLAADKQYETEIARMKNELYKWMKQQNDPGKELDVEVAENNKQ